MSDVPIKEYIDELRKADQEAIKTALAAADKRLDGMNEFRQTLSDQASKFLSRDEYYAAHQGLIDKIDGVIVRIAAQEGNSKGSEITKANVIAYLTVAVSILGLIVLSANHVFK